MKGNAPSKKEERRNIETVRRMWATIQDPATRDLDSYEALLDTNHVWTSDTVRVDPATHNYVTAGERLELKGTRLARTLMELYVAAFPDLSFDQIENIVEGHTIASRWHATGTHDGDFMGIAPTGQRVNVKGASFYTVIDGKIVKTDVYWDVSILLRQMGWEGWSGSAGSLIRVRSSVGGSERLTTIYSQEIEELLTHLGVSAEGISLNPTPLPDSPFSRESLVAEQQFRSLAEQWRRETGMLSSISKMAMHPAYQRIIGMGARAIGPILRELQTRPDHWFWALNAITGENPVPQESVGNLREMAKAWIRWGRMKGYLA